MLSISYEFKWYTSIHQIIQWEHHSIINLNLDSKNQTKTKLKKEKFIYKCRRPSWKSGRSFQWHWKYQLLNGWDKWTDTFNITKKTSYQVCQNDSNLNCQLIEKKITNLYYPIDFQYEYWNFFENRKLKVLVVV